MRSPRSMLNASQKIGPYQTHCANAAWRNDHSHTHPTTVTSSQTRVPLSSALRSFGDLIPLTINIVFSSFKQPLSCTNLQASERHWDPGKRNVPQEEHMIGTKDRKVGRPRTCRHTFKSREWPYIVTQNSPSGVIDHIDHDSWFTYGLTRIEY